MNRPAAARYFSPAETALRLGVTIKALRLYERHGLVAPLRSEAGWRVYGPEQIARLHQVLALKALGLTLARIAELLKGSSLADVLALQERALSAEAGKLANALTLIRSARARLAAGQTLSLDDLTQLAKETTMTSKPTDAEMKALFDPLIAKHYTAEERAALAAKPFDQAAVTAEWDALMAEAKTLMAIGDPASPAALDLARRWQAQVEKFTGGDPGFFAKAGAVWKDAMSDPATAPKMPMNPELFGFMGKAMAALKANG